MQEPESIDVREQRLQVLRQEHRDLDDVIDRLQQHALDQLLLRRLKKRKLQLKDLIQRLESALIPDIIA
jgi:hypothetical protein